MKNEQEKQRIRDSIYKYASMNQKKQVLDKGIEQN